MIRNVELGTQIRKNCKMAQIKVHIKLSLSDFINFEAVDIRRTFK